MNLETRARNAATSLRTAPRLDAEDGLRRLHRAHRRRTTGKVIAAAAAVAVAVGVVQTQFGQDREVPPVSPTGMWVLVTGSGVGGADNPVQPVGGEWAEPLAEQGVQNYPNFLSADPATQRFLVINQDATAYQVMTPGRAEPLTTIECDSGGVGCFGMALGPGPDELTALSESLETLVVLGYDGKIIRPVGPGPAGGELLKLAGWAPDGETWAEIRTDNGRDEGSLTVVLRRPDSAEETTLYEYSEAAPPWYDADEHRFGDGPGAFNDWWAPRVIDLEWAPDSTRLAFVTITTPPDGEDGDRHVQWQLFVADTATGEVDQIADLGRCAEPVHEDGQHFRICDENPPSLAWTPDGESLTVLSDSTLTRYDPTGKVLDSEPTTIEGPLVWLQSK